MTDTTRPGQHIKGVNARVADGDCEADPVPALWYQDDDDLYAESGFIDRFWLPLAIAVLAGWGSVSFALVNAFGWMVILAIVGVVFGGVVAGVVLVKAGSRNPVEIVIPESSENTGTEFRKVA